jgi:hypothetical protein
MKETFSVIAGILTVVSLIPYIRAILRKETKPAKASWLIWASLNSIILVGMFFKGSVNGQILGSVIGNWIVLVLALKRGTPGWTRIDKSCLCGAVIGIVLWKLFDDPVFGIATSLIVAFFGSIPTFVSAWKDSSRENKLAWTIVWVSCVFTIVAIPRWTVADAAQPIVFLVNDTVMMYILYIHPRRK